MSSDFNQSVQQVENRLHKLYSELKEFTDYRKLIRVAQRIAGLSDDALAVFSAMSLVGAAFAIYLRVDGILPKELAAGLLGPFLLLGAGGVSALMFRRSKRLPVVAQVAEDDTPRRLGGVQSRVALPPKPDIIDIPAAADDKLPVRGDE